MIFLALFYEPVEGTNTDIFSKLVRTVPLKRITAPEVAKAFVTYWVFVYGPPFG